MDHDAFGHAGTLRSLFDPKKIAVLGPTDPGSLGEMVLRGLTAAGFERPLVAIDPQARPNAFGVPVHRRLQDTPAPIDLAVIVTGRDDTLPAIAACVAGQVKGVAVLSSVHGSADDRRAFDRQVRECLRESRTRLLGPECCAVMNPSIGLNIGAALPMPIGGNVAFITQSGSLATAVIDWSHKGIAGFSTFVSVGDMVDIGWGNLIDYFGDDPATRAILIHMESIVNMRSFLSAARAVAQQKPIVVAKAGRIWETARAFPWHQRCQVEDDEVFDAALRRVGVIRVHDIEELFHVADAVSKQPRPKGPRLAIVTNSGASGVLAADHALNAGALVAPTGDLPGDSPVGSASRTDAQPFDVLGDGSSKPLLTLVEKAARHAPNDAVLVVLVPQALTDPLAAIEGLLVVGAADKPILLCLPGPPGVPPESEAILRACLPVFPSIGSAVRTFSYMWRYSHDLKAIYETPELHADEADREARDEAGRQIAVAQGAGGTQLSDARSREVLARYGIASLDSDWSTGEGGASASAAGNRYELAIGSRVDPEFGPVVWLGIGGRMSDLMSAQVVGLPPFTATLARRVLERSPLYAGLQRQAARHLLDLAAIDAALVRLSQLVVEQPAIREVSINPLVVSAEGAFAGNARISLWEQQTSASEIPKPVFRPFPIQYVSNWTTRRGLPLTIRPIRAEDERLMAAFHAQLSESAVYQRYFRVVQLARRTSHEALTRVCFVDYDREMALVAERRGDTPAEREILAVANLTRLPRANHGEVAVLVADRYQQHGIGSELVRRLVEVARDERLDRVVASTMADNHGMCAVFSRLGFALSFDGDDVRAELEIGRR